MTRMRSVAVRALAGAMALVVVAAGCGGKKSDGGGAGASGAGMAPGLRPDANVVAKSVKGAV